MAEDLFSPESLSAWSQPAESAPSEPEPQDIPSGSVFPLVRVLAVVVVLPAVVGGLLWLTSSSRNSVDRADVGDCMPASVLTEAFFNAKDQSLVDCDGADAAYSVLGIVKADTFEGTADDVCSSPYPSTDEVLWLGEPGEPGVVFCLRQVNH
jgi:hypothetical protein